MGCSRHTSWQIGSAESSTVRTTNIYPFPKMLPDRALDSSLLDRGDARIVVVDRYALGLIGHARYHRGERIWAGEERSATGSRNWSTNASGWRSRGAAPEGSAVPRASAWRRS